MGYDGLLVLGMKGGLTSFATEESEIGIIGCKDAAAHLLQLVHV